jgi:hypothetical protein
VSEKRKQKLTKARLLKKLEKCAKSYDTEAAHCDADALLVEYIDDEEIAEAYSKVDKWYA